MWGAHGSFKYKNAITCDLFKFNRHVITLSIHITTKNERRWIVFNRRKEANLNIYCLEVISVFLRIWVDKEYVSMLYTI